MAVGEIADFFKVVGAVVFCVFVLWFFTFMNRRAWRRSWRSAALMTVGMMLAELAILAAGRQQQPPDSRSWMIQPPAPTAPVVRR